MDRYVFKILPAGLWHAAQTAGVFTGADVDIRDGYIHLSNAAQAGETARLHFAGQEGLVLLTVDGVALGDRLVWEPSRGGDLFPHLYGPLPVDAVVRVADIPPGPDGIPVLPAGLSGETL